MNKKRWIDLELRELRSSGRKILHKCNSENFEIQNTVELYQAIKKELVKNEKEEDYEAEKMELINLASNS